MTVSTTPRFGITRWSAGSDPFGRTQEDTSHAQLEALGVGYTEDLAASRPAPGKHGWLFLATDTDLLSYDTGSAWVELGPISSLAGDIAALSHGGSGSAGSSGKAADAGHVHPLPAMGSSGQLAAVVPGAAAAAGSTGNPADAAHRHAAPGFGTSGQVSASSPGDSAAAGGTGTFADTGHRHAREAAAPVDGAAGTASLRTLGTAGTQAAAGNDSRLSNARTPLAHTHVEGDVTGLGSDLAGKAALSHTHTESAVTGLSTDLANRSLVGHQHNQRSSGASTVATEDHDDNGGSYSGVNWTGTLPGASKNPLRLSTNFRGPGLLILSADARLTGTGGRGQISGRLNYLTGSIGSPTTVNTYLGSLDPSKSIWVDNDGRTRTVQIAFLVDLTGLNDPVSFGAVNLDFVFAHDNGSQSFWIDSRRITFIPLPALTS